MSADIVAEESVYLSPDELQIVHSATSLWEHHLSSMGGDTFSLRLAKQSARRLAAWHCPATWVAAPLVIPALAQDANIYQLIDSTVSPDVAHITRRYLALDEMELLTLAGRRGIIWTPFQRLQKLFIASYLDEALVFLSIADMISRLEYLEENMPEDRKVIARQLEAVLLPLFERFSLWQLRWDVSDRLFALIYPSEASDISDAIQQYDFRRRQILEQVEHTLLPNLRGLGVDATISHHRVRPSRVHELAKALSAFDSGQNRDQWRLTFASRIAFDVSVADQAQCYAALGAIHQLWRFIPGNFRDYIGSPKFNGYRMIHTTVRLRTLRGKTYNVEFYIGTPSIRRANLEGRVHEWRAGEGPPAKLLSAAWWHNADEQRRILNTHRPGDYSSPTYVFSPVGQLYLLDRHSTPIDFAYAVHSELGQAYESARVNGRPVPHNFPLANADIVDVHVDPHFKSQPRSQWLAHVKTPLAASKIRKQLARRYGRMRDGQQLVENAIEQRCERLRITLSEKRLQGYLKQAVKWFNCADMESLFLKVVDGVMSPDAIAVRIVSHEMAHRITYPDGEPLRLLYHRVSIAQCCQPTLDDAIIGHFSQRGTRHERVKIHAATCSQIPRSDRTLDLVWRQADYQGLYEYLISGYDRLRILLDVLEPFYDQGVYLHKVQAERLEDGSAQFLLIAEPENVESSRKLEADLRGIRDIYECSSRPLAMAPEEVAVRKRTLRQSNPFAYDRPVYRKGDFVGRDRELGLVENFINQDRLVNPVIVYGPWRIGKTSLLRYIEQYDRSEFDAIAVYVNCHDIHDLRLETLLAKVAEAISNRMRQETGLLGAYQLTFGHEDRRRLSADPTSEFRRYLGQVQRVLNAENSPRLVIMIDEFSDLYDDVSKGRLDGSVFRNLRGLIEGESQISFVLVVQAIAIRAMQYARELGAELLEVARLLPLGPIEPEAAKDLLTRRAQTVGLSFNERAIAAVLELSGCNPYLLNVLTHKIVEHLEETGEHNIQLSHVESAVRDILREHGGIYFAHLCELVQNDTEREIIRELVRTEECAWKSGLTVAEAIDERRRDLTKKGIRDAFDDLVDRGVLITQQEIDATAFYRLQMPLFARWLQARGPVATKEM
ncbi:MAG: TGS domain-containing protein [Chloroflexota bacterium]|nr:TGS domain-containing protein [Chloroflexota bacterium]